MVFCNIGKNFFTLKNLSGHNPYFNRWFSAIVEIIVYRQSVTNVTILILIDGFLQYLMKYLIKTNLKSHNPYFNRWFSAIF